MLNTSNGQTIFNPTISNSSGNYFISSTTLLLNNGEITCNSNILCSVQCINSGSCQNTIIRCNDAINCNIECIGDEAICESLNIQRL